MLAPYKGICLCSRMNSTIYEEKKDKPSRETPWTIFYARQVIFSTPEEFDLLIFSFLFLCSRDFVILINFF